MLVIGAPGVIQVVEVPCTAGYTVDCFDADWGGGAWEQGDVGERA
jgi:hypothetical protein